MKPFSCTLITGICLIALWLVGCVAPNMRVTKIGSVSAIAFLNRKSPPLYHEITITQPTQPGAPAIRILLSGGQIIDRASWTVDALKRAGFVDGHSDYRPKYYDRTTGDAFDVSHQMAAQGISVVFAEGYLVEMRMRSVSATHEAIQIGREGGGEFYPLPLTKEQLEHVFGHPNETFDKVYW